MNEGDFGLTLILEILGLIVTTTSFMYFKILFLSFFILLTILTNAQTLPDNHSGFIIGLHIATGTHFDRIGISCNGYFAHVTPVFRTF